jgi:hypothetical protein
MTTAPIEQSDHPRWPMKFTDPRDQGLPQEDFDRAYVDCDVLGGITRREYCRRDCSTYQGAACPLGENNYGCEALTTSPSEEGTGNELTLKAATVERVDAPAQVKDGDGDGRTDSLAPSARASDMVERDSKDGVRPSPAPLEPVEPELPIEAEEPGASATKDSPPAAATATAAEPPGRTPPGHCDSTESDTNPSGEAEPLVAVEDVPDVPVSAPAAADYDSEGVLEGPTDTSVQQSGDEDAGESLWDQLVAELGDDTTGLSMESVSPDHIATWHERANMLARKSVVLACAIGLALGERKKQLNHGQFQAWIEEHCPFSYPRAATYMRVARKIEQNYRTRHFRWQELSIRELDRLLPGPGRKNPEAKKEPASAPASTTTSTREDAEDGPSNGATGTEAGAGAGARDGEAADGATAATPETTVDSADAADAIPGIEAALARVTEEIKTSPDPQACAREMFSRIVAAAGITALAKMKVILLRPIPHGVSGRTIPKRSPKSVVPAAPTEASPRPHGTLRFADLVSGRGAGA